MLSTRALHPPVSRWPAFALLTCVLAGGCDHVFEPFQENAQAGFSMFGYLDLYADTQWVRVMPVRQNTFLSPEPIDAVVTLEHLGSGRVVTLRDSLVRFPDPELGTVAYAHNFWTTESLEPLAEYRLEATRSDGLTTTALVTLPDELHFTFYNEIGSAAGSTGGVSVRAEHVPFVEIMTLGPPGHPPRVTPQDGIRSSIDGHSVGLEAYPLGARHELRVTAAPADWPYHAEVSDLAVSLQGRIPTNVGGGYGFVGGLATWTIPYHRCDEVVRRRIGQLSCRFTYNAASASLAGRVIRQPCGSPHRGQIRLIERFTDGGVAIRHQVIGAAGEYRFEGIEPGTELVVEVRPWLNLETGPLAAPPVQVPVLGPGDRYAMEDITVSTGC